MKTLIDFDGAGTLVNNTKTLVENAISAHNADLTAHGGASAVDASAFTDTFVTKVSGKDLSSNDFTDAYKEKLEALSTETQVVNLTGVARFYVGPVAPTDTSVIWFDTSAYLDE